MSLRGRILEAVLDWRSERAMRKYEQAAKDPRWARSEGLFNFAWNIFCYCLLALVAFMLTFIAISYFYRYYPSTTCVVLQLFGLCK